ncbi:MAG: rRNA methylase [Phycisphaeraceae bacterium]|nr:rRNA methylase [Phycisphaeraceae bacterium]
MNVQYVRDLQDPRLRHYRNLKDRQLAREGGVFLVEGEHGVRRLLESDFEVASLLVAARRLEKVSAWTDDSVPIYIVEDGMIHDVVGFKFHSGILACGRRPAAANLDEVIGRTVGDDGPVTFVVCPQVLNHENLGSLMRTSAALGADAMVIGPESCDPFWRRAIRVSMGAVFRLPLCVSRDLAADLERLRDEWSFDLVATVADDGEPLATATRHTRTALLFGSESQGLDNRTLRLCNRRVTIPMRHGIDSLNVTVAAAVILHHFQTLR